MPEQGLDGDFPRDYRKYVVKSLKQVLNCTHMADASLTNVLLLLFRATGLKVLRLNQLRAVMLPCEVTQGRGGSPIVFFQASQLR